ncbi:MAG: NADH-quinone oxidoreductase subunit L [Cyclobacteriaceae bacterium]|nr:NADH-quinone oxidoreductase subunit L [Cyclobacteriaceae bacterium]MCH8515262.1 NADH-quinone oxidoreductase subunit L [Cyclobacteriaceae bacterium]
MTLIDNSSFIVAALAILVFPIIGFTINGLLAKSIKEPTSGWIATLSVGFSFLAAVYLFFGLPADSYFTVDLFQWIAFGETTISFGLMVDALTVTMLLVITGIGMLIHMYSISYMHGDEGFTRFFTYLNMFVFFMLVLVMGSNYLIMFIGWEGVGLCSYLLIGFWFKKSAYNDAAKKAFVMNRVGDLGYLLAIFLMLFYFGTLDYSGVMVAAQEYTAINGNTIVTAVAILLFVGAMGKSAQLPLSTWLPDAMAGPTPVSALIHAATMVTAGIYMVVRSNVIYALAPVAMDLVLVAGVLTCVYGAVIGLMQNDIKKVLAYSTVSQLGLMFAALGLGAFSSGMFHVVTHAFFKALLFLGAGSVIHALSNEQDMRFMGGLSKSLKTTYTTVLIGSLAIAGIFPFAGFFSKDEILAFAFEENLAVWIILSASAVLTAFYMFRLIYLTFSGEYRGDEETKKKIHESPALMTIPLWVLAGFSIVIGFIGMPEGLGFTHAFKNYLAAVTNPGTEILNLDPHAHSVALELILIGLAMGLAVAAILYARKKYVTDKQLPHKEGEKLPAFQHAVYNKFYLDELYDNTIVKPIRFFSDKAFVWFDKNVLDIMVSGSAQLTKAGGNSLRLLQNGNTGFYLFLMVSGTILLFIIRLLVK